MNERYSVFENGKTLIECVTCETPSAYLAVIFSLPNHPDLELQQIFVDAGYDILDVRCTVSNWYQDLSHEGMAGLRQSLGAYTKVVTCGVGTAGYAALYFAAALGAYRTIALSPQAGLDESVLSWDPRWEQDFAQVERRHLPLGEVLPRSGWHAILAYDPRHPDGQHALMIEAAASGTIMIPLPYSGTLSGTMLQEVGILRKLVESPESVGGSEILAQARAQRWNSVTYCFALGMACQARNHLETAAKLLARAHELSNRPDIALQYSRLLVMLHRPKEALPLADQAIQLLPPHPHWLNHLGYLYELNDDLQKAAITYDKAIALEPSVAGFHENARRVLHKMLEEAEAKAAKAADRDDLPPVPVGRHAPGWGEGEPGPSAALALLIPIGIVMLLWFTGRSFNWI